MTDSADRGLAKNRSLAVLAVLAIAAAGLAISLAANTRLGLSSVLVTTQATVFAPR